MKTNIAIWILVGLLFGCEQPEVENPDKTAIVGSWEPVATYYNYDFGNVRRGWNAHGPRSYPSVTFRADGTFTDSFGFMTVKLMYKIIDSKRIEFSGLYKGTRTPNYEFRNDTLIISSGTLPDKFAGTKYIRAQ
ncbi:MAG: hypothetical protein H7Z72_07730 [Bacteroidetes bacterium]|nr:hypothetical protein [Fibrella sp.]